MADKVDSILKIVGSINPIIGAAGIAVKGALDILAAVRAANPGTAIPTDAEAIEMFMIKAGLMKGETAPLRAWLENLIVTQNQPPTP